MQDSSSKEQIIASYIAHQQEGSKIPNETIDSGGTHSMLEILLLPTYHVPQEDVGLERGPGKSKTFQKVQVAMKKS